MGILGFLFLLGSRLCGAANNENKVKKLEHSGYSKPQRTVLRRRRAMFGSGFETAAFQAGAVALLSRKLEQQALKTQKTDFILWGKLCPPLFLNIFLTAGV